MDKFKVSGDKVVPLITFFLKLLLEVSFKVLSVTRLQYGYDLQYAQNFVIISTFDVVQVVAIFVHIFILVQVIYVNRRPIFYILLVSGL